MNWIIYLAIAAIIVICGAALLTLWAATALNSVIDPSFHDELESDDDQEQYR